MDYNSGYASPESEKRIPAAKLMQNSDITKDFTLEAYD